jgi:membrane protein implicated in regulation of membrane protease activity
VPAWAVWIVLAAVLAVGEILTPGLFVLGPIGVAAGIGALAAALGVPAWLQLVVFAAASVGGVAVLRPIARRHLHVPAAIRTGTAALVGARGTVVERVDAHGGRVKIGGEIWSARAFDDAAVIEAGTQVDVVKIEGATALVYE